LDVAQSTLTAPPQHLKICLVTLISGCYFSIWSGFRKTITPKLSLKPFTRITGTDNTVNQSKLEPGAIIGDGDRKRAPFLVLGLSPWYGTIILFLQQIAPSPAANACTCCEDFCGCRAGGMASEIPEIFHVFGPQLNAFTSVGILLKYLRRKLLQFEWSKTVSNLGVFRFKA